MTAASVERVRSILHYDRETGVFAWKVNRTSTVRAGMVAGTDKGNGYLQIQIDGRLYLAHRLAWFYETGEWPAATIDHRDHDPMNNAFANLRCATQSEQRWNMRKPRRNTSGFKGVVWIKPDRIWGAQIGHKGDHHWLGRFDTPEAAHAAYCAAAREMHGQFANYGAMPTRGAPAPKAST